MTIIIIIIIMYDRTDMHFDVSGKYCCMCVTVFFDKLLQNLTREGGLIERLWYLGGKR